MEKISSDVLALINEAAILVTAGKISFLNFAARELIGSDCSGKKLKDVLGAEVAGCQSASFIAEVTLKGEPCTARVSKFGSQKLIFLSASKKPDSILNEPFLYTMRNSLMSLELSANLLRSRAEEFKDEEALKNIAIISKHYYRMTRLINNASFVLSEDIIPSSSVRTVNISKLYSELLQACSFFAPEIEIRSKLGEDILLDCDEALIKKLLLNLIANCISHAKGCRIISVNLIDNIDSLVLSVSDDGCGIPSEALPTVFERYRYGFDISEMAQGPGLGLTVVRRIARMHGGTLLLESRVGVGTTVRVSLAKRLSPLKSLYSKNEEPYSLKDDVLLEFSDCLGSEYFSEKFMD